VTLHIATLDVKIFQPYRGLPTNELKEESYITSHSSVITSIVPHTDVFEIIAVSL